MRFQSPVMSISISLSGEFLCVAQAEKKGIYMYVDKTLYETIHFWREPTEPTLLHDSSAIVSSEGTAHLEGETFLLDDQERSQEDPPQQTEEEKFQESSDQKGNAITLSALPRAYWTTLFHLEAVKARNRPKAPPKAPEKAPFFLPTVVRETTPSFPTPLEYAQLQKEEQVQKKAKTSEMEGRSSEFPENDEEPLVEVWEDRDGDEELKSESHLPTSRILKDKHRANLPR